MTSTITAQRKLTFEEFLDWALKQEGRYEWVDGEVIPLSPSNRTHQHIANFLFVLIDAFVQWYRLGEVYQANFLMRLPTKPSGREPDILFVANERLDKVHDTYLDGPADLAIEVVSPDSEERNRQDKLQEYERARVREYWVIDPLKREERFYQLSKSGRYERAYPNENGIYRCLVIPEFWIDVNWLRQASLPNVVTTLRLYNLI